MQSLPKPASVPPTPTTRTQSWATSNPRPASRPYTTPNTPSWRSPAAHTRASYSSIPALTPLPSGPEATAPSTLNDKLKHAQQQIWEINNALACGKDITPAFDSLMSIFPPTMFEGRKHTMAELEVERIIQVVSVRQHEAVWRVWRHACHFLLFGRKFTRDAGPARAPPPRWHKERVKGHSDAPV